MARFENPEFLKTTTKLLNQFPWNDVSSFLLSLKACEMSQKVEYEDKNNIRQSKCIKQLRGLSETVQVKYNGNLIHFNMKLKDTLN